MDKYEKLNIKPDLLFKKKIIFAELFILQNRIQTKFDKLLGDISSKQFIILVIVNVFPYPPSLSEVAKHAGCSRQNVKKIASVLQDKGFIELVSDRDTRSTRIVLLKKFYDFFSSFEEKSEAGLNLLFNGFSEEEIESLFKSFLKLEDNIDKLGNEA